MTTLEAYRAARAADVAWSLLLHQQFGKAADDVRHTKQGTREPGTALRAYEEFRRATDVWLAIMRAA